MSSTADREFVTSRLIDASRDRVFRAFSDPIHLARWWGPRGFTNTFEAFDLRPGGAWRFVMHGPDGASYPNESVFAEVSPPDRIVFNHNSGHHFQMTISFSEEAGKTRVGWRQVFDTPAERERIAGVVIEANEQNLDRLAAEVRHVPGLESIPGYVALGESLATAGQPSEAQLAQVAAAGFGVVINLGLHSDPSYSLKDEGATAAALGMQYIHIPVQFSSPTLEALSAFSAAMARAGRQKVFVHCRHNKRVPVFVALDRILRQGWSEPEALGAMRSVWQPDATWNTFIAQALGAKKML